MKIEEAIKVLEALDFPCNKCPMDEACRKAEAGLCDEAFKIAIASLRVQQERENPKPLTLDDLREMNGEPVYCTFTGTTICGNTLDNGWYIVSKNYEKTCIGVWPQGDDGVGMVEDTYGKMWLAYRYKPKEEKHDKS